MFVLKKTLLLFGRETVAHWDSATVFFQRKSKMYFTHFIGSELSGGEAEGSAFLLQGTENNSSGDFVT